MAQQLLKHSSLPCLHARYWRLKLQALENQNLDVQFRGESSLAKTKAAIPAANPREHALAPSPTLHPQSTPVAALAAASPCAAAATFPAATLPELCANPAATRVSSACKTSYCSGTMPARPSTTARSVAWPKPVKARLPYKDTCGRGGGNKEMVC